MSSCVSESKSACWLIDDRLRWQAFQQKANFLSASRWHSHEKMNELTSRFFCHPAPLYVSVCASFESIPLSQTDRLRIFSGTSTCSHRWPNISYQLHRINANKVQSIVLTGRFYQSPMSELNLQNRAKSDTAENYYDASIGK